MWGTLSLAGKLAAARKSSLSSVPLVMRQPTTRSLHRKPADNLGPLEVSWDADSSNMRVTRTPRGAAAKKGSLNLVSTSSTSPASSVSSPKEQLQLDMERAASLQRWDYIAEGSSELSRTRQRDIEVATITKEMEKQGSRRGTVLSIGRGTAFKESLDFARAWLPALTDLIKTSILPMHAAYRLLTNVVAPEKIAVITLDRVLGKLLANRQGASQMSVIAAIADAMQAEYRYLRIKKENPQLITRMRSSGKPLTVRRINRFEVDNELDVPTEVETKKFAAELFNGLVDLAKVDISSDNRLTALVAPQVSAADQDEDSPSLPSSPPMGDDSMPASSPPAVRAFLLSTITQRSSTGQMRKLTWLTLHAAIYEFLSAPRTLQQVAAQLRNAPMLIPPHPWTGTTVGPYLITPVPLMRTKNKLQLLMLQKPDTDLSLVCKALNVLGGTPWRINKLTLAVVQEAWNNGGGIADLPPRADVGTPPVPPPLTANNEAEALRSLYEYKKQVRKVDRINSERHSLRCDFLLKLGVAETYVKEERFYFPHNLDFRGRAYPVPPHLNHIGADLARGLLKFADGRPLGTEGLTWLKIHLSNTVGYDKVPFEARVAFVEENLPMIFDSADRPLNGGRWWLKADSPWQCLAACIELTAALRSPDPTAFVSNLPVHQDGSCNGLQHYAALGGDVLGAEKVNMLPADSPQDLYASVAELVSKRVENEAQRGDEMAKLLRGKVSRKVIKQTVMTSVYGVTFIGARDQIRNAIKDLKVVAEEHYDTAALYLARLTFDALREMFFGAKAIMEWLGECATRISKNGRPVTWVTPMGLPVVQPYMKPKTIRVATLFQDVSLYDVSERVPINTMKQKSAFPPNYIHSLDSTHMFYTALECHKQGLTFASVHDSFWTHACAIPQMSKVLREQFIHLHSQPLLEALLSRWQKLYPNIEFPPYPQRGPLDLNRLMDSKYFFH